MLDSCTPFSRVIAKLWLCLPALLLWAAPVVVPAQSVDLLKYTLQSLDEVATEHDLDQYTGKPTILIFFEPECSWCLRQTRVLNELVASCENFQAIAIGVNGTRRALQNTLRRLRAEFPAYQISRTLQEDIGEVEATPLMLLADDTGAFVTHMRGYQRTEVLVPALENFVPGYCA